MRIQSRCHRWLTAAMLAATAAMAAETTEAKTAADVVTVDFQMIVWTWVVFVLLAIVLYKLGFKPMLEALDKREATIREGLEAAAAARQEMATIEARREALIRTAEEQAKEIVEAGRKAAREAAQSIEDKARQEAQILGENARREIASATDAARASLRRESGELAVKLAARILNDNLDEARNRALVEKLIAEI